MPQHFHCCTFWLTKFKSQLETFGRCKYVKQISEMCMCCSPKDLRASPLKWLFVLFPLLDFWSLWLCTRVVFLFMQIHQYELSMHRSQVCTLTPTVYLWNKECNLWCSLLTWCSADQHSCKMWHVDGRWWNLEQEVWSSLTGFAGGIYGSGEVDHRFGIRNDDRN